VYPAPAANKEATCKTMGSFAESAKLAALVASGELQPVAERLLG
jgi:hypothetical protein